MMDFSKIKSRRGELCSILMGALFVLSIQLLPGNARANTATFQPKGQGFESPQKAVSALIAAVQKLDVKQTLKILGPDAKDIIFSGDEVQSKKSVAKFLRKYNEKHKIEFLKPGKAILYLGKEEWPYPVPIINVKNKWYFDTHAGREEIVNRRIGANELMAIKVLEAYVEAQLEYAGKDRDGDGILEFAQKIKSDKGKKNGLYWPAKPGEKMSPFGPLVARAAAEGYKNSSEKMVPFHGYYFKILTRQGKNAPGGAYNYIVKNNMVLGFGMIACPAKYGVSGIMTFIVNHKGIIYEADLGKKTDDIIRKKFKYDPAKVTWHKVSRNYLK